MKKARGKPTGFWSKMFLAYDTATLNTLYQILLAEEVEYNQRQNNHNAAGVVDCGIVECRLLFSANVQGPSSAFFKLSDGGVLEVKMTDYAFHPERSSDYFIQDQSSFDSDWILTDLR